MIYILPLLVLIPLIIYYDIYGQEKYKWNWYKLVLFVFICISAFGYNVGSDTPGYMEEYAMYGSMWKVESWNDLFVSSFRQPGWSLLNSVCASIGDFSFLKVVIAIFLNSVVFSFIKKHTKAPFIAVLFYAISLYLTINFNAIRQAVAVSFFLLGYDSLSENKLIRYFLCAFGAYMFHSSGLLCLLLPIIKWIRFNSKGMTLFAVLLAGLTVLFLTTDMLQTSLSVILESGVGLEVVDDLGARYLNSLDKNVQALNINGVIFTLFQIGVIAYILLFNYKYSNSWSNTDSILTLCYLGLFVLNFTVPIIFERLLYYFQFIYFCALSNFIVDFPRIKARSVRVIASVCMMAVFSMKPINNLLAENEASGISFISQFYPYHSIFDREIDPVRAINFGYYSE